MKTIDRFYTAVIGDDIFINADGDAVLSYINSAQFRILKNAENFKRKYNADKIVEISIVMNEVEWWQNTNILLEIMFLIL